MPDNAGDCYDGSLGGLFALLARRGENRESPGKIRRESPGAYRKHPPEGVESGQGELFSSPVPGPGDQAALREGPPADHLKEYRDALALPIAGELYESSPAAHDGFVHGWMSELPIEAELIRYARRVIAAARSSPSTDTGRCRAEQAALDRGDPAARTVLEAAYKVKREIHRIMGFLRFSPNPQGLYIARCGPDYFMLPAVAEHFLRRFGETPWAIIDERRFLCLIGTPGDDVRLLPLAAGEKTRAGADPWEDLWRNYYRSVNNESRSNPALRRQFMPRRYWKYLPEMDSMGE